MTTEMREEIEQECPTCGALCLVDDGNYVAIESIPVTTNAALATQQSAAPIADAAQPDERAFELPPIPRADAKVMKLPHFNEFTLRAFAINSVSMDRKARAAVAQAGAEQGVAEDIAEGIEILDNLIDSVRKHGNYSPEATLTFLSQARQCFAAAPQPVSASTVDAASGDYAASLQTQIDVLTALREGDLAAIESLKAERDRYFTALSVFQAARTPSTASNAPAVVPSEAEADDLASELSRLSQEAESKRQDEDNEYLERIWLGMRDAYDIAANKAAKHGAAPAVVQPSEAVSIMDAPLTEICNWPEGGNRYGQGNIMKFAKERLNEARRVRFNAAPAAAQEGLTAAAYDVLAERQRQVTKEGWTPKHDDTHQHGTLAKAAACYAAHAAAGAALRDQGSDAYKSIKCHQVSTPWPWDVEWWKPTNPRRDLVKAGALILAEIERIDRAKETQ